MASVFSRSLNGVHVPHHKNTQDCETQTMPMPGKLYIAMSQHMGPPCDIQVNINDEVKVGQVIGSSEALFSAPIHSGASGRVAGIEEIRMPDGDRSKVVVIETDKLQTPHESLTPPVITDRASFLAAVKNSGMVGLGGAGFPTHVKLNTKNPDKGKIFIVNGAECEPYITSDYRTMLEDADDLLAAIRMVLRYLEMEECIIAVETNKPKGIEKLRELTKNDENIRVMALKTQFPQGAETVLIYQTTGRVLPEGKLPADVGVIVSNISTVAMLGRYFREGMPLVEKRLTVSGNAIANPQNVKVPVGTPIRDVIAFCGGYQNQPRKLLMGGPMMGTALWDDSFPVLKKSNAILALGEEPVEQYDETPCIRCGKCVRACPVKLMPLRIEDAFDRDDTNALQAFKVNLCIECGCCAYVCPAKRHLVQVNRLAKARLRKAEEGAGKYE